MPKLDPKGEVLNPIRAKLAGDISRPLHALVQVPSLVTPVPQEQPVKKEEPINPLTSEAPPSTKLAKPKKVLFTVAEQKENDTIIRLLGEAVGAPTLGWSHVNRALWSLLRRTHDLVDQRRPSAPHLARPSNGNPIELARFEDSLAQYLLALFKDVPRQPWN